MKNLLNVLLMTLLIGIVFSCQKDAPAPVEVPDPGLKSTPTTHYVNPGESIQEAVDAASHGDIIMIAPGIYEELVFIIEKDLTLIGEDGATILSPNITDPVPFWDLILVYGCNANFENLSFDGGNYGGGLNDLLYFVEAGGEVTGCTFQNVNGWGI